MRPKLEQHGRATNITLRGVRAEPLDQQVRPRPTKYCTKDKQPALSQGLPLFSTADPQNIDSH
jgi:hypothetical protein